MVVSGEWRAVSHHHRVVRVTPPPPPSPPAQLMQRKSRVQRRSWPGPGPPLQHAALCSTMQHYAVCSMQDCCVVLQTLQLTSCPPDLSIVTLHSCIASAGGAGRRNLARLLCLPPTPVLMCRVQGIVTLDTLTPSLCSH